MYEEYANIRYFYEQHLRESKKRQKQNELMRSMQGSDRLGHTLPQSNLVQRIFSSISVRNLQPTQDAADVRHAPAN